MCICVHCNHPLEHVYTTYRTKSNIRLEVCSACGLFADPLIEHPRTVILIDLLLLKPRVYRHLLFNHGSEPARAGSSLEQDKDGINANGPLRAQYVRKEIAKWAIVSVIIDACVRLNRTSRFRSRQAGFQPILWDEVLFAASLLVLVVVETLTQHLITTTLTRCVLSARGWLLADEDKTAIREGLVKKRPEVEGHTESHNKRSITKVPGAEPRQEEVTPAEPASRRSRSAGEMTNRSSRDAFDGRQLNFRLAYVPLALIYSSILPLSLYLITSIWSARTTIANHPSETSASSISHRTVSGTGVSSSYTLMQAFVPFTSNILARFPSLLELWNACIREIDGLRAVLKRDGLDEVWMAVHLLEGMSSGGALRVLLPTRPWETSLIVLAGLLARTAVTVGLQEGTGYRSL